MLGLRTAEALGVQAIEADVHLFRGRLEVRHLKTLGPIPLLWDRWRLANPFRRRLVLAELLAAIDGRTVLVLDLKGRDPSMAAEVAEALAPRRRVGGHTTVCARDWRLLEELEGSSTPSAARASSGACCAAIAVAGSRASRSTSGCSTRGRPGSSTSSPT